MPKNDATTNSPYTDAPRLHPNLILGSLHLLFWLFFRPTAWRNHIARIDPTLRSDFWLVELTSFWLVELTGEQWHNPALRRLLVQVYLLLPLFNGLIVGLILWQQGSGPGNIAFVLGVGVGVGVPFGVGVSVAFGVGVGVVGSVMGSVAFDVTPGVGLGVGVGVAFGMILNSLFVLPLALVGRLQLSTAIAGLLMRGGFWILVYAGSASNWKLSWWTVAAGFAALLLGFTLAWWRPIVLYPLLFLWNFALLRLDERRFSTANRRFPFLRYHSAFWDEHQRLPLIGLDEHIVLIAEHDPTEAQAAIDYLSTSRQRWAAQAAQIELDARSLERCPDVHAISQAHQHLAAGELAGPASALLRSLSRISQDVAAALNQATAYNQRLALRVVADRLDGLLRELTRSSERYAVRFRPIATHWQQVIMAHVRELTAAVEARQEIDSPYVIGVPLTSQQEIFVGRTDISARIEQLLLDRRWPPLLLYGQRRMGKTSLLNNLGWLLPSSIVPLFVDLQGPVSQAPDHASLLYNLARQVIASAQKGRNLTLPELPRAELTSDPFTRFDEWLDQLEQALAEHTILLTLDEFEALDDALNRGRFDEAAVLGFLRHTIQHRPRLKLLLAGSHTLEELARWASYLINVQVVHMGYLHEPEARQLIEHPVGDFALRYEADAPQRVLDLTRCHPFLVQLLCAEIVALKNEQPRARRRLATRNDVEAAIPAALQSGSFFFADIRRNQVDATGLALLRFLAGQGEGAVVSEDTFAYRCPTPDLPYTLARLLRRDLIERCDGGYRFQVELIRRSFVEPPE